MLPDDVFRTRLQATITALRYWAPTVASTARVEETSSGDYWRLAITPITPSACPLELILHSDQHYDIFIAGETYEGRPIDSFDWFLPLAEAVAEGQVVQRQRISRLTGLQRSTETLVALANGEVWFDGRDTLHAAPPIEDDGTEIRERRFLPYHR
ncbi:hypothetical protein [Hyphomicrobium sp. D-2]|uniref:hypothetical protein n=1 Tax=Hyphomicrobium sp. D-2 TaxID=3041621 RepID=UPI0024572016|nr:hypothetical protein [Hyphomicrobium sp. D-2]MDH4982040.1 hypothetical protein [Hyphomicrobium sp. D-2]